MRPAHAFHYSTSLQGHCSLNHPVTSMARLTLVALAAVMLLGGALGDDWGSGGEELSGTVKLKEQAVRAAGVAHPPPARPPAAAPPPRPYCPSTLSWPSLYTRPAGNARDSQPLQTEADSPVDGGRLPRWQQQRRLPRPVHHDGHQGRGEQGVGCWLLLAARAMRQSGCFW